MSMAGVWAGFLIHSVMSGRSAGRQACGRRAEQAEPEDHRHSQPGQHGTRVGGLALARPRPAAIDSSELAGRTPLIYGSEGWGFEPRRTRQVTAPCGTGTGLLAVEPGVAGQGYWRLLEWGSGRWSGWVGRACTGRLKHWLWRSNRAQGARPG